MKNLDNKTKCCIKNGLVTFAATGQAAVSAAPAAGAGLPDEDNLPF